MLSGMAVSTSAQCDYAATLAARDEDGAYVVRAVSLPFFAIVPLGIWLNNRWLDRHQQSAHVRAFALSTPGIAEHALSRRETSRQA